MLTESTLTCPGCGHRATEQMPTDACQFFYVCKGCGERHAAGNSARIFLLPCGRVGARSA
jgi:transcription elongation factor Elf1